MASKNSPKKCVVPFCEFKGTKGYSEFPKDETEHAAWLGLCALPHVKPRAIICHSHFSETCFSGDYTPFMTRRRLKKNSRPSERLPHIIKVPRAHPDDVTLNEEGADISEALKEDNTVVLEQPIPADHTYDSNHNYWFLAYQDLEKTSKKQKRQILKLERQLRMANMRLSQYKAGKMPKDLVKKVCHDNLIGPGKFLTKNQVNWMIETTEEKPREKVKKWENPDWKRVCYFTSLSLFSLQIVLDCFKASLMLTPSSLSVVSSVTDSWCIKDIQQLF